MSAMLCRFLSRAAISWRVPAILSAFMAASASPARADAPIAIVAAENFYGDVAQQLGGPYVKVTSILNNPDEDPHLFEASASTARALADATIAVYNGADYDPWMASLLAASPSTARRAILVADLVHKKPGDNPHLWYATETMPAFAKALEVDLVQSDPAHRAYYAQRLRIFDASLAPLDAKISEIRDKFFGIPVTATEPVFGYMATALGFEMRNQSFQLAIMNDTEPSASEVAQFEDDLQTRRVRLLLYNAQASDPTADRMEKIALAASVPVVGVCETEPSGKNYQTWMLDQLTALEAALLKPPAKSQ